MKRKIQIRKKALKGVLVLKWIDADTGELLHLETLSKEESEIFRHIGKYYYKLDMTNERSWDIVLSKMVEHAVKYLEKQGELQ